MKKFKQLFKFNPDKVLNIGVERERFLVNILGEPIPETERVLKILPTDGRFGYELSGCQLEDRVGPVRLYALVDALRENDREITKALAELEIYDSFMEVAGEDMDLSVYNDPTGRYQRIVKDMPRETLLAACRVAGTHVHVGMPDLETALLVYNKVIPEWEDLCECINNSNGERLRIYQTMAPDYIPKPYESVGAFYEDALEKGFDKDPRKNWQLIRITVHGTIECRMGGSTADYEKIQKFAARCHQLCQGALIRLSLQFVRTV